MTKLTVEQALQDEVERIWDALGSCLQLTNPFLERYCGKNVRDQLGRLTDESERAYALDGCIVEGYPAWYTNVGCGATEDDIVIPIGEIEVQFEGPPEQFFEEPEEWAIEENVAGCGNLAYLQLDAVILKVDVGALKEAIDDMFRDE